MKLIKFLKMTGLMLGMLLPAHLFAQYPPPAGQPGSTAISKDSSIIIGWASHAAIERGYINIADTSATYNGSNMASYGSYLLASGPADGYVVSLGDHGTALLSFDTSIMNAEGPDFVVFENSFDDAFLELAFVEVSSDGKRFVRFPSVSLTQDTSQIATFGTIDATKIHNLAGKYRMNYGTPFDLEDLRDSAGINLLCITQIRLVDVGGSLDNQYASFDSQGHKINDPWPTPFDTGGFDLDAIGVLHTPLGIDEDVAKTVTIHPNPVADKLYITTKEGISAGYRITDIPGKLLFSGSCNGKSILDVSSLKPGVYIATFFTPGGISSSQKIVKY